MRSLAPFAPFASLALCLGAAVVILWGGLRLGVREESLRRIPDREPLKTFAATLQREYDRLENLYESHLRRVAGSAPLNDDFEIRDLCEQVIGIRQFSRIHVPEKSGEDYHIQILPARDSNQDRPVPYIQGANKPPPGQAIPLSGQAVISDTVNRSGWIDVPGNPMLFWAPQSIDSAVVFHIDRPMVMKAIEDSITRSLVAPFGEVSQNAWRSPTGQWVGGDNKHRESPDFLLPVQTRFGTWELASWDVMDARTVYDTPMIASAATLATMLGGCGFVAFLFQRRSIENARQRVSFVNRVSHELRTPLTNIQLNADLAAEGLNGSAPESMRRIALVRDEAQRLGRLIDNVLTFSRGERNTLKLHPSSVIPDKVIDDVLEQFAPALERRGIEVVRELSAAKAMALDADALAQILANLVSNVEKYAADGKLLRIAASLNDSSLTVMVADAGRGIVARNRERIFNPFKRLSIRADDSAGGAGLGLTIARDLARRMGGTLVLKPSETGAMFILELPTGSNVSRTVESESA